MTELAPQDADMFWRAQYSATDQFALYCFAAERDCAAAEILSALRARADRLPRLHLRVAPARHDLAFPRWCAAPVVDAQFRHHPGPRSWDDCRAAVAGLLTDRLDATAHTWRLHLFGPVDGAPRAAGLAWVVVLQVSHALADGRGVADLARALLGPEPVDEPPSPAGPPPGLLAVVGGAVAAPARVAAGMALGIGAWRRSAVDSAASDAAEPGSPATAATVLNRVAGDRRRIDVVVADASALRIDGATVTVSVLARLAEVLGRNLGIDDTTSAVELTVGREPGSDRQRQGRNNFHNAGIRLHPELARAQRVRAIDAQIRAARERDQTAGRRLERRAAAATPAVLRALAVRLTPTDVAPAAVVGATVVSSVHRGPADLTLAGGAVLFTAGFPALSAAHAMTIGVHAIGGVVAVSITTDPDAVDADCLVPLLAAALDG